MVNGKFSGSIRSDLDALKERATLDSVRVVLLKVVDRIDEIEDEAQKMSDWIRRVEVKR